MHKILGLSIALAAMSGCANAPFLPFSASTQGTTVVRSAVVSEVEAPASANAPYRIRLRYDTGGTAVEEVATTQVFKAGDRVRVTHNRGTMLIERLD